MASLPLREQGFLYLRCSRTLVDLGARDGVEAVIKRFGELEARAGSGRGGKQTGEFHELLRQSAVERGLDDTPAPGPNVADDWRRWFSKHKRHYAARLGKITARAEDD